MSGRGEKRLFRKLGSQTRFRLRGGDEQTCRTTTITQAHLFRFNDGRYNSAQMIDCKGLWMHYCVIHYQHLHKTSLVSRMFSQASIFSRDTKLNWSWSRSHYCVMALKSPRRRTQQRRNTAATGPTGGPEAAAPLLSRYLPRLAGAAPLSFLLIDLLFERLWRECFGCDGVTLWGGGAAALVTHSDLCAPV